MSRLKRKASFDTITLYHMTSSQLIPDIVSSGYLLPSSMTDQQTRPKTNYQQLDVAVAGQGQEMSLFDLIKSKKDYVWTDRLQKYIEDVQNGLEGTQKEKNELMKTMTVPVSSQTLNPSSGIGVYLSNEEHNEYYLNKVAGTAKDSNLPVIPTEMKVKVSEAALSPDLYEEFYNGDDSLDRNSDVPLWKQSLEHLQECIHQGPIPVQDIEQIYFHVAFFKQHHTFGRQQLDNFTGSNEDFLTLLDTFITGDRWIPFTQGVEELEKFYASLEESGGTNPEGIHVDEKKITRYDNPEHNNFYGPDVIYKDLTQQELTFLEQGGGTPTTVLVNNNDIYYGFAGANVGSNILQDLMPDLVIADNTVFFTDSQVVKSQQSLIQTWTSNPVYCYYPSNDWLDVLDSSQCTSYNSLDEVESNGTQQTAVKRLKRKL